MLVLSLPRVKLREIGEKVAKDGALKGRVKWFDSSKGFGFIVADGCENDILLHANVLRSFGRNSIAGNAEIEFVAQDTDRGCQAIEILAIEAPVAEVSAEAVREILGADFNLDPSAQLEAARVKWFDRAKGFGFVNIFGHPDDVFVHMEVLHLCGLSDLQPGEAVCVRAARGPRGMMAWDVRAWDQSTNRNPG